MYRIVSLLVLVCTSLTCRAEVRLPKILGSSMVLQRDCEVRLWGWANAGEAIKIRCDWLELPVETQADAAGNWQVMVATTAAIGPHAIKIEASNEIDLKDILFGEVWLASGQSNMEMPLVKVSPAYTGILNAEQEVAAAEYPRIRLFQVGNYSSAEPQNDVAPGIEMYGIPRAACQWNACTSESIPHFAATAYFFARHLHTELKVPIGIVDASWGGTMAEAWTPAAALKKLGYQAMLSTAASAAPDPAAKIPGRLYNGMIHPLEKLRIKGVIWYQGEGNAARADKYRELFSTMIATWRQRFEQDFPFYFAQISPFGYNGLNSAYLREAQLETMSVRGTGMAVTMDIGNLTDIHPKNKQEVGRRLALWALANDYGHDIDYSGPVFRDAEFDGQQVRFTFDHAARGLKTNDGQPPNHFFVAGEDRKFHPAIAVIDESSMIVSSDQVPEPKAVRYAFSNDAQPNLVNQAGLPASSFRTDRWQP